MIGIQRISLASNNIRTLPDEIGKVLILFDAKEIRCMPIIRILIYNLLMI